MSDMEQFQYGKEDPTSLHNSRTQFAEALRLNPGNSKARLGLALTGVLIAAHSPQLASTINRTLDNNSPFDPGVAQDAPETRIVVLRKVARGHLGGTGRKRLGMVRNCHVPVHPMADAFHNWPMTEWSRTRQEAAKAIKASGSRRICAWDPEAMYSARADMESIRKGFEWGAFVGAIYAAQGGGGLWAAKAWRGWRGQSGLGYARGHPGGTGVRNGRNPLRVPGGGSGFVRAGADRSDGDKAGKTGIRGW